MTRNRLLATLLVTAAVLSPLPAAPGGLDPYAPAVTQFGGGGGFDMKDVRDAMDRAGISERDLRDMAEAGYRALSDGLGRPVRNFNDLVAATANLTAPFAPALSSQITAIYKQRIDRDNDRCRRLPREFRLGCVRDRLGEVTRAMPREGDYAPMRASLDRAVRQLTELEQSSGQAAGAARQFQFKERRGETVTTGALTPIRPAAVPTAHTRAIGILDEAQTELLRSHENSRRRQQHYVRMAEALESSKLLLGNT